MSNPEDRYTRQDIDDWEAQEANYDPYTEEEDQCQYGSEGCLIEDADYCIKGMTKYWWQRLLNRLSKKRQDQLEDYYRAAACEVSEWCSFMCSRRPSARGGPPE